MTFRQLLALLVILSLFGYTVRCFYRWWKGMWIGYNRNSSGPWYERRWGSG